ncbi:hypothetical protein [Chryseobacterium lathyri]|uniref:YD repeat-containing protein n=1 Tax=Chryseobacterium lathyri TaxID=395933 RepID=A0ABT9SQE2_9FLAO|nr:hypothetical protein [Chryseobacterium lathyri]MDP9961656.1 hypothetical protein [Chryseobacterium lathyri]
MKKIIILLGLILFNKSNSQSNNPKDNINIVKPELNSLLNFSNFSSINNNGAIDVSIPIFDIKVDDLDIPIKLRYNTKGIKVSEIASNVGLGWTLETGGSIIQQVNDSEDFSSNYVYTTDGSSFEPNMGFFVSREGRLYREDKEQKFYSGCGVIYYGGAVDTQPDTAPDFFIINAPGLNDKFYFSKLDNTHSNYKGTFINNQNNKLINSSLQFDTYPRCVYTSGVGGYQGWGGLSDIIRQIQIKNERGYTYIFSSPELSNIEYFPKRLTNSEDLKANNWNLESITLPSSKKVEFTYEPYSNNYRHLGSIKKSNINVGNYNVSNNIENDPNALTLNEPSYTKSTLINKKRVKKIIFNNHEVIFNYNFTRQDYPENALSSIEIKTNNSIIRTINFNYNYFLPSGNCNDNYECLRLKLVSINDSSNGNYSFSYGQNDSNYQLPKRTSSKTDFLGYFNDNPSNYDISETQNNVPPGKLYFYPQLQKDNFLPFKLNNISEYSITEGLDKTPNSNSLVGLLSRVYYPTQGYLEIKYENDDFDYLDSKYLLGSSRIKNLKLYDTDNSVVKETNYLYAYDNGKSSGQINFIVPPSNIRANILNSGIGFNSDAILGYSFIKETVSGKGSHEYDYSNFSDFPDMLMNITDLNNTSTADLNYFQFFKFPNVYVQSFDVRRGNIKQERIFKEGQPLPIRVIDYIYEYNQIGSIEITTPIWKNMTNYQIFLANGKNNIYQHNNLIKSITRSEKFSNNQIITKSENSYNNSYLLSSKKETSSDNIISETFYQYAYDKNNQKLINANMIGIPLEEEVKKNSKTISKTETKYDDPLNLLPTSVLSYDLQNTTTPSTEVTHDKYDSKGNLQQYTAKNGISTTIIWGYNQTQPIAKIEGAKLSDISQSAIDAIVNASNTDASAVSNNDETSFLDALKTFKNSLPNYQITTYTYDPLIGVRSITPPSGIRELYKYDTANRLEKVIDINGKVLKEFKYNYKN